MFFQEYFYKSQDSLATVIDFVDENEKVSDQKIEEGPKIWSSHSSPLIPASRRVQDNPKRRLTPWKSYRSENVPILLLGHIISEWLTFWKNVANDAITSTRFMLPRPVLPYNRYWKTHEKTYLKIIQVFSNFRLLCIFVCFLRFTNKVSSGQGIHMFL